MNTNIEVPALARVEGEGALLIRLKNGEVSEIEVNIYEPPRFFEGFLRGRFLQEVPDITARICGICPVAYQMSSVQAFEAALGVQISPEVRALRRLFYCGEYIESHALHIYLLQGPDLLGYPDALSLATVAPEVVKNALRMKKIGNQILSAIGGRSVHPVNACVGGFYRWPKIADIKALLPDLEWCLQASLDTVRWASTLPYPEFEQDYEFVALHRDDEYGILEGDICSSSGARIAVKQFEALYLEKHVAHSNALHSHTKDGAPYLTGPLARLNLNYNQLHPLAKSIFEEIGLQLPLKNPYKALLARAIELVEVNVEAIEHIKAYDPQGPAHAELTLRASEGAGASEAPRGLLYHRYIMDNQGLVLFAKIVPPTAQNLARMEADLWELAPQVLKMPHAEAQLACEHLLRSYDPCISCATHFLKLQVENE
jgi:coenzyme F420-reducing hydrogenase alpha subunit